VQVDSLELQEQADLLEAQGHLELLGPQELPVDLELLEPRVRLVNLERQDLLVPPACLDQLELVENWDQLELLD